MNKPCARITLDLQQASTPTFVAVKKSDIGREIRITLSDGGFPYEISADCYAVLTGTKPDGNILYNHCDIEGNTIVYEITEQTTAAAGRMKAEVKLYGADDILVTSATFRIIIDGTVYTDDKVESSSEFSALRQLMSQVLEIIKNNSGESGGGISITIVKELPTEDISTNTLYLVKDADVPSNIYTEYMYVNGEWEIIGSQQLNLSGYVKTVNSTGPDGNGNVDVVGISSVSRVEPIGKGTHTTQIQLTNGDTIDISVTDGEDGTDGFNGSDGAAVYLWDSSVGDLGSGRYSQTGITLPNGKYPKNGDTLISKDGGVYLVTNYYMASFEPVFQFSIGGSGNSSGGNVDQSQIEQAVADYLEENPIVGEPGVPGTPGTPGVDGEDGFSPVATVEQTASGATITIRDANGTTTATVTNGKDGSDGQDGKDGYTPVKGVDYFDGVDGKNGQDGYTPQKGIDYFDGQPGKDGVDGKDGYTPVKGVDYFDGKPGKDGKDGNPGTDGYTPVKGTDYFTEADIQEIAEQAAGLVEIPDSAGYVVQDTAPQDTSVLWVDLNDNSDDGFQEAVNMALAQAKASGEFDGADGQDGKDGTDGKPPVKGTDYFTAADKAEMINAVIAALPVYTGEVV